MALATAEIEQITGGSWVVRLEVGGMIAKRATVAAPTLGAAIAALVEMYSAIAPAADVEKAGFPMPPAPPAPDDRRLPPLRDAMKGR